MDGASKRTPIILSALATFAMFSPTASLATQTNTAGTSGIELRRSGNSVVVSPAAMEAIGVKTKTAAAKRNFSEHWGQITRRRIRS